MIVDNKLLAINKNKFCKQMKKNTRLRYKYNALSNLWFEFNKIDLNFACKLLENCWTLFLLTLKNPSPRLLFLMFKCYHRPKQNPNYKKRYVESSNKCVNSR